MTAVCKGAPPSTRVQWVIVTKNGETRRGYGQTAFVAAASVGVLLSEVRDIQPMVEP